jgi:hypothetical protein
MNEEQEGGGECGTGGRRGLWNMQEGGGECGIGGRWEKNGKLKMKFFGYISSIKFPRNFCATIFF